MHVVHLTSSRFHGGPERQMLGLALALPPDHRTTFVSFAEEGCCSAFLNVVRRHGFEAVALANDTPRLLAARAELVRLLCAVETDVLCCHGYKANVLGRMAARRVGLPALAVSRGWTGEKLRVRFYEAVDRLNLRWMDHVVCVSEAQAEKVRRAGVVADRVSVIRNAISSERFEDPDPTYRKRLQSFFPTPPARVVGAAGRLSPEKGFGVLVDAARTFLMRDPAAGVVLFGEGPLREGLAAQVAAAGLGNRFILAGFRDDLDRFVPFLDLFVMSSFTEGMPNAVLEAFAARVPVVATAVGGTPEVVEEGASGYLVPPGDASALAARVLDALACDERQRAMGLRGHQRVAEEFTFAAQSEQYQALFRRLTGSGTGRRTGQLCASIR